MSKKDGAAAKDRRRPHLCTPVLIKVSFQDSTEPATLKRAVVVAAAFGKTTKRKEDDDTITVPAKPAKQVKMAKHGCYDTCH